MEKNKEIKSQKNWITIVGAREHNLKDITVKIPKEALTVITGPSGSGKSSLALDILYAEGQRRYMESLSSYARQFLGMPQKPDFDRIDGLCPAIAINQKTVGSNPRSTVGTITEIYDYLRILFARIGITHCPSCKTAVQPCTHERMMTLILEQYNHKTVSIVAPWITSKKGEFTQQILAQFAKGFRRFIIDDKQYIFANEDDIKKLKLPKTHQHTIDIVIDSVSINAEDADEKVRLQDAIEKACALAQGTCKIIHHQEQQLYSTKRMCLSCGASFPELEPRMFSFNSPLGACRSCEGIGHAMSALPWFYKFYSNSDDEEEDDAETEYNQLDNNVCIGCNGNRLNKEALAVTITNKNIADLCHLSIKDLHSFFSTIALSPEEQTLTERLIGEIIQRLQFLLNVGLDYLSLDRTAESLSGGEGQRIRLARQLGSALSGILYVLDEPSIGLHQRDNDRLIETLKNLRDMGNTVVVVEHDHDTMLHADYIIDMGPEAGVKGGQVIAAGTPTEIQENDLSVTGAFLAGKRNIERLYPIRKAKGFLTLEQANAHNLKNITTRFPLGVLCCISGVSGSGKSSLIIDELVPAVHQGLSSTFRKLSPKDQTDFKLKGIDQLDNMVVIDQSPIGRSSRSNPATYLGIFNEIRNIFSSLPESIARGYKPGRFSFNVEGGRCATCRGDGVIKVSMHFLPDVITLCRDCNGKRYSQQILEITFKGKNIADVLNMTAYEALSYFEHHSAIKRRLELLCLVGLDYLKLGQTSSTLSGGESQRIKLVDELAKRGHNTLYILDEPTTGLHSSDIERLLFVFNKLVDKGNSLIVIEHNLDVLKTADYIIDMGPEGGTEGGAIVAEGTPEEVARIQGSYTGMYLKRLMRTTK